MNHRKRLRGWIVASLRKHFPRLSSFLTDYRQAFRFRALVGQIKVPLTELPDTTLQKLRDTWANQNYSAPLAYLQATVKEAWKSSGPVMECGSGLTTILLGLVARQRGIHIVSLEHNPLWARRVLRFLKVLGLSRYVTIVESPLKDYGEFSWYSFHEQSLPPKIHLVICDGPPGITSGGRYGLLPLTWSRLESNCIILMDDLIRKEEQDIVAKWEEQFGVAYRIEGGDERPFARIETPESKDTTNRLALNHKTT